MAPRHGFEPRTLQDVAASILGPECLPVRAILFDKNADQNWSLGWHQDRTIAVRQRIDIDGFGPMARLFPAQHEGGLAQ